MVFLSKVERAFFVQARGGCVVVPISYPNLPVKAGDAVQLRGPNGCSDAHVRAVEYLIRRNKGCRWSFLLSGEINCSEIGPDTEIWVEQSK